MALFLPVRIWRRLILETDIFRILVRVSEQYPVYSVFRVSGPEHLPVFEVEVRLHKFVANGSGTGRRAAESAAAANLLRYLKANDKSKK